MKYIRELHKVCDHVPSVSPQLGKDNRHFIGIIVMVNSRMYAIPITRHDGKPQKRKTLHNNAGYTKVITETGRLEKNRKRDLKFISDYVNEEDHSREIANKAITLYNQYISNEPFKIRKYCLPFNELEIVCDKYNKVTT